MILVDSGVPRFFFFFFSVNKEFHSTKKNLKQKREGRASTETAHTNLKEKHSKYKGEGN